MDNLFDVIRFTYIVIELPNRIRKPISFLGLSAIEKKKIHLYKQNHIFDSKGEGTLTHLKGNRVETLDCAI